MEMLLTCKQCRHEEHGDSNRALMAKVRMQNHLNRAHEREVEPFKYAVEEHAVNELYTYPATLLPQQ